MGAESGYKQDNFLYIRNSWFTGVGQGPATFLDQQAEVIQFGLKVGHCLPSPLTMPPNLLDVPALWARFGAQATGY